MLSAEKFLDLVAEKDLVPGEVLEGLRRRLASSAKPIPAEAAAKHLVQAGHLTAAQAQRLLQQLRESQKSGSAKGVGPVKEPTQRPEPPESTSSLASLLEEELGLAPLEEEKPRGRIQPTPSAEPSQLKPVSPGPGGAKPISAGVPGAKPTGKPAPGQKAPAQPAGPPGKATKPTQPTQKGPAPKQPAKPPEEKKSEEAAATKKKPSGPSAGASAESPPSLASLLEEELGALEAKPGAPSDLESLLATSAVESAAPLGPLAPVAPKRTFWSRLFGRGARPKARGWDSPLILVGSGALVILILVGIVLILVLRRESGDALLEAAHADFAQGSYTQAIFKYNQFLERFSGHPGASLARVRRGVAQLRQVVEEGRDWPKALQTAQEVLDEIAAEEHFREAHAELASLLPAIAKGLADNAQKQPDPAPLQLAEQTLALVDRYVPRSLQSQVELDEIRASLALSARRLNQQAEIEKTVSAIQKAIQNRSPAEGYRLLRALLRQYPEAAKQDALTKTLQDLKQSFQDQLQRSEPNRPAETEDPLDPIQAEIALGAATGQAVAGAQGDVVVFCVEGCVYALEGSSGTLLWRRLLGPLSTGRSVEPQPLPVSSEPDSDLILVGAGRKELWRLERATGRLRWRSLLPGPALAPPVLGRRHVLVLSELAAGRSRLEWIDLDSGAAVSAVELPQKVEVAPAVDLRRDRIYLVGEHSYLWTLSLQDGQCLEVVSIGHEPASIAAPPLALADWVLVAENHRLDRALLKLVAVGQPGQTPSQIIFQEELPGHVDTPPVAADRRVVVLTDRGAIQVYEIQTAGGKTPLARAAERGPEGPAHVIRFPLLVGQELWIAGHELTRFAVQTAQGRLEFRPPEDPETGDIFLLPPLALEKAVVHVRCRPGAPGVWAAAVDRQTGKRQWQTHLAVPPAGEPIQPADSPGKLWVVTQTGEVFAVEVAGKKGRHAADPPIASLQGPPPGGLSGAISSSVGAKATSSSIRTNWSAGAASGRSAGPPPGEPIRGWVQPMNSGTLLFSFSPPTDRWFLLDTKQGAVGWTSVSAPTPLAQPPTPFADGVLAPTGAGRIELRDARTGEELVGPFQPPLEPGRMPAWGQPTVLPPLAPSPAPEKTNAEQPPTGGKPEFLVSDGLGRVYRVGIQEQPKPHLKALALVDLPGRPSGPIAVVGQTAWLVEAPAQSLPVVSSDHEALLNRSKPPASSEPTKQPSPSPPSAAAEGTYPAAASGPSDQGKPSTPSEPSKTETDGGAGRLVCLSLPNLERKESARLEGRCVWGPARVGEFVLLATDAGQYLLADGQGRLLADLRTHADPPTGAPIIWKEGILLATCRGRLVYLSKTDNNWKMEVLLHLSLPLASGPCLFQDQLVLLGHDSTIYILAPLRREKQERTH